MALSRIPRHVGVIPDGNRRWAVQHGMEKHEGYAHGVAPGLALFEQCRRTGVEEVSVYCFTKDNVKRAATQKHAFTDATLQLARALIEGGADVVAVGDRDSASFPAELAPFDAPRGSGQRVNLLVNYGWDWDLAGLRDGAIRSQNVSRMDLVIRWGGGRRLSGFLPVQSVYADIFVEEALWPDCRPAHFKAALAWFAQQDRTLGG